MTFQILVFLMVVNDLSAKVHEDVELPPAVHTTEVAPDDGTVVVNVLAPDTVDAAPRIRIGGRSLDLAELTAALRTVAELHRPVTVQDAETRASVLIRGDRGAPWRHVQLVLQACADQDVRIRRVQFATENHDPPEPGDELR